MHGSGMENDFIVVDGALDLATDRVRELGDRRRGVGTDGILVLGAAQG